MAQSCISLSGSTQCSAFSSASISTDSTLVGFLYVLDQYHERLSTVNLIILSPFLQYVSSTATFDSELSSYVSTSYVQEKYVAPSIHPSRPL
jgi:hypothetical protein